MITIQTVAQFTASTSSHQDNHEHDVEYAQLLGSMQGHFNQVTATHNDHLFTTDVDNLFDVFLQSIPTQDRQYHNCNACRSFVNRFGALVAINEHGETIPATIPKATSISFPYHGYAIEAMYNAVKAGKVTGVFLSREQLWGIPEMGGWQHFHIRRHKAQTYRGTVLTPGQAMAEKAEDFKNLSRALAEYKTDHIEVAVKALESDALYRSEKVLGAARWLLDLSKMRGDDHGRNKRNKLWLAVAGAPAGFCHPRSRMIGTLLDDIAAGKTFDQVKRSFDAKLDPLKYQRPTAAPNAGNIAQAEALIDRLGCAASLSRRYARLDEVQALWRTTYAQEPVQGESVFGHLKPGKPAITLVIKAAPMSVERFMKDVMPGADSMELYIPAIHLPLGAMVTASDPHAPPIIAWDHEDERNPVSHYVYAKGSPAHWWNLPSGKFVRVNAVTLMPHQWNGRTTPNQASGIFLALEGAKDKFGAENGGQGLCLFPEALRSELHPIRSTIEAFSATRKIDGYHSGTACGLFITETGSMSLKVRVVSGKTTVEYELNRFK